MIKKSFATPDVVYRPAASALTGNVLEMHNLRLPFRATLSESAFQQDPRMIYMHSKVWEVA